MKHILLFVLLLAGCTSPKEEKAPGQAPVGAKPEEQERVPVKTFENKRFKEVTIEKTGAGTYRVRGKAQLFEATLSYVVEDGHYELLKGFETTDAGAPEWGNFDFTIQVKSATANTRPHLILFESSPKDGSRQHELAIPLPGDERV